MSTTKSTSINHPETAAAFDANRFFGHTPEQRWYASRASKKTVGSRRDGDIDLALTNAYDQYPIEAIRPTERKLSEQETAELTAWILQAGQALVWYRTEATGGVK